MGQKLPDDQLQLYRRVDEALFYIWDPIGISRSTWSRDEYQAYLPQVFRMLVDRKPIEEIVSYLVQIESEHMGLGRRVGMKRQTEKFVNMLMVLRDELLDDVA